MADYVLKVNIDEHWISQFNKHNMRLCCSFGVQSGNTSMWNVIAFMETAASQITIEWQDSFSIAAAKDGFDHGARFAAETKIQPITFGETLTLPQDWTDKEPKPDPKAPTTGFRFVNETIASAVLYKPINGKLSPIYISDAGPLPPGHEDLTPKTACRVWFANDVESAEMISDFQSNYLEIDMTGSPSAQIQYDATGTWLNM